MWRYTKHYLLLICLFALRLNAQDYGHEWIDFSKTYYKIPIAKDAIYHLSYNDLINAGIPINTIDPRSIKLYLRGKETAINITGQNDGVFNPSDYLEFFGVRNRGEIDLALSTDITSTAANPHYAVYTDTTAFFLTWGGISGKRISNITPFTASGDIISSTKTIRKVYNDIYSHGINIPSHITISEYDEGEGWMSNVIVKDALLSHTFSGINTTDSIEVEIGLVGINRFRHKVEITFNNQLITTIDDFSRQTSRVVQLKISQTDLINKNLVINITPIGFGVSPDVISIAYMEVRYKENIIQNNDELIAISLTNKKFGLNTYTGFDQPIYDITDVYNVNRLHEIKIGNHIYLETKQVGNRQLLISNSLITPSITPVLFEQDNDANYLMISHQGLSASSVEYANYRKSVAGGSYDVSLVYMDRIINQYGYGERSPFAIRNYCRYMYEQHKAEYLLMIGKPSVIEFKKDGHYIRRNPNALADDGKPVFQDDLMTGGSPGGDYTLSMGYNGITPYVQALATGRLSAKNNEELRNYLDKIKEYEINSFGDDIWRKRIIHLSGGKTVGEQSVFRDYMRNYETIAKKKLLGAEVVSFNKESSQEIVFFNVSDEVNKGVGLINYFGHSAPFFIEIDIGNATDPENGYNNKGKYPILIFNGCEAGNIYVTPTSTIENWVFAKDKGAIGAIAHTSFGYSVQLNDYTEQVYKTAFTDSLYFEETFGKVLQQVAQKYSESHIFPNNGIDNLERISVTQLQQFVYLGDPAIRYFPVSKPDYAIEPQNVWVVDNNNSITAQSDSFQLAIEVTNYGRAIDSPLNICVKRNYSNNLKTVDLANATVIAPYLKDTFYITIYNDADDFSGNNNFIITLDCGNEIDELDKSNNSVIFSYYLPTNGLIARSPQEFAIVGNDTIDLVVESSDRGISGVFQYRIQVDTNPQFTAPFVDELINGGIAISKQITLPYLQDSTVYFWRSILPNVSDVIWIESSFMYITNQSGWGQGHPHQFSKNSLNGISIPNQIWQFDSVTSRLEITSSGDAVPEYFKNVRLAVNNQAMMVEATDTWNDFCVLDGIYVLTFDRESALPYHYNPQTNTRGRCGFSPRVIQDFNTSDITQRQNFVEYLKNIEDGAGLLIYSGGNAFYSLWEDTLIDRLEALGVTLLDSIDDGVPYIFVTKKGEGSIYEAQGSTNSITINATVDITGIRGEATVSTPLIGPVSNWKRNIYHAAILTGDTSIYEFETSNQFPQVSFKTIHESNQNYQSYTLDNASLYQYAHMRWKAKDSLLTAPQLQRWVLLYDGVPEGILLPSTNLGTALNVAQGDSIKISTYFVNISNYDFEDSLYVSLTYSGGSNPVVETISQLYVDALQTKDTLWIHFTIPTLALGGDYNITIQANSTLITEASYENNSLNYQLTVRPDKVNPLLDITFDGRYILDGDIVSPSPYIVISMRDDNKIAHKTDTIGWTLFLKPPCEGCGYEQIFFSSAEVQGWHPATASSNFRVELNFKNLSDGIYTLRVQGTDAAGNKAAQKDVETRFKVINKSTITHFYPYPNPFSSSCRFVFTLTGNEIPQHLLIRIMTISGVVVKEINQEELGAIHIGNNISSYAWDGTDQFGDKLANGVYLYQVLIDKQNNDSFEHSNTSADDKSFHRRWGKMYILR